MREWEDAWVKGIQSPLIRTPRGKHNMLGTFGVDDNMLKTVSSTNTKLN